jgi:hypothetical protein
VKQRRRVDPRWVGERRMSQAFAAEQVAMMELRAQDDRTKADAETAKDDRFGGSAGAASSATQTGRAPWVEQCLGERDGS